MTPDPRHVRRLAERIHAGGPRPLGELIAEVIAAHPELVERVEAYARLDPAALRLLGADRFPPALFVVGGLR